MKLRFLPSVAILVFAARFLHADPVAPPAAEAPKPAPAVEPGKPAEPTKAADLPSPNPWAMRLPKALPDSPKHKIRTEAGARAVAGGSNRQSGTNSGRVEGDQVPDPYDIGNTAIALQAFLRAGHNPETWLADVLTRLPGMTNQDDLTVLLPSRWQPSAAAEVQAAQPQEACTG